MKSIVAATDLSPRSDRAVARAFALAAESGARLKIVTVVDEELPDEMRARVRDEAQARLDSFAKAQRGADKVDNATKAIVGDEVRDVAVEVRDADLLVLGVHRLRPIVDIFASTTLERLARVVRPPVLVVRSPPDHDYRLGLAAVDLSPASAAAIRAAGMMAPKAKIHPFHAFTIPFKGLTGGGEAGAPGPDRKEAEAAVAGWLAGARLPAGAAPVEIVEDSVTGALNALLARLKPDFLAIGAHGRSALNPHLLGGFAAELLADPPCDILLARR